MQAGGSQKGPTRKGEIWQLGVVKQEAKLQESSGEADRVKWDFRRCFFVLLFGQQHKRETTDEQKHVPAAPAHLSRNHMANLDAEVGKFYFKNPLIPQA